jgi:methyl-accepting chemotaxis protein
MTLPASAVSAAPSSTPFSLRGSAAFAACLFIAAVGFSASGVIWAQFASVLLLAAGLYLLFARIVRPLLETKQLALDLLNGGPVAATGLADRSDEIGEIAHALSAVAEAVRHARNEDHDLRERMARVDALKIETEATVTAQTKSFDASMEKLRKTLRRMAHGDLDCKIAEPFEGAVDLVRQDFNAVCDHIAEAFGKIVETTHALDGSVKEIVTASDDLSQRTERQAAALEQTVATLGDVTKAIHESHESLEETRNSAASARSDAEASGEVVKQALAAMSGIEESAKEITKIVSVIDEIAFQTNLLALNAGVEAARAGDAGRGFAVVAAEVRALAQRSAVAAKEIEELIGRSADQVASGSRLVDETGSTLQRIAGQVLEISANVEEIAARSRVQSESLRELNLSAGEMDSMTQQNAAMAEEATAASYSLAGDARHLTELVGAFRLPQRNAGGVDAGVRRPVESTGSSVSEMRQRPAKRASLAGRPSNLAIKEEWAEF